MARRTRQISLKECYDILRLKKGATLQDVKTAYRRRAFELHPDLNPGDPEAGRQFQLLNEAYVALSAMLKDTVGGKGHAADEQPRTAKPESGANAEKSEAAQTQAKREEEKARESGGEAEEPDAKTARASAAYAEQDVLRDLLQDPFARRVFEDIYSELNKTKEQPEPEREAPQTRPRRPAPQRKQPETAKTVPLWEKGKDKGVKGAVKDWLRRQIDDEQSLVMPSGRLTPGSKIRLRIRKSMADEPSEVDVRLPPDFAVGKPMRLRGLGKRVGPWQGDLYLTIYTQ